MDADAGVDPEMAAGIRAGAAWRDVASGRGAISGLYCGGRTGALRSCMRSEPCFGSPPPIFRSKSQLLTGPGPTSGVEDPATRSEGTDFSQEGSGGRDGLGSTHTRRNSGTYGVRDNSSKNA